MNPTSAVRTLIISASAFGIFMSGVCDANASTTLPVIDPFFVSAATGTTQAFQTPPLQFPRFNPALGTLTSVDFSLTSSINPSPDLQSAQVLVNGVQIAVQSVTGAFDFTNTSGLNPDSSLGLTTDFYTGSGNIGTGPGEMGVVLALNRTTTVSGAVVWTGNETGQGLTLVYDYVPIPTALSLFATGLGLMGLLVWLRSHAALWVPGRGMVGNHLMETGVTIQTDFFHRILPPAALIFGLVLTIVWISFLGYQMGRLIEATL